MAVTSTLITSTATGTYGVGNDLAGQASAALIATGMVTQVSDNTATAGTTSARTIVLKVESSLHYLQLVGVSSGSFNTNILKVDGVTALASGIMSAANNVTIRILHGTHSLCLAANTTTCTYYYALGDDENWYAISGSVAYGPSSDSAISLAVFSVSNIRDSSNNSPMMQAIVYTGVTWVCTLVSVLGIQDSAYTNGSFYSDGTNNYMQISSTTQISDN
jgi:hypothetical protein